MTREFRDQVRFVEIGLIDIEGPKEEGAKDAHEYRFRQDYGDMQGLVESVKERGILQPLTVGQPNSSGRYPLLAGRRRLWAATSAGLPDVPVLIRAISGEIDLREIELLENVMRKDFEWQEQAALVQRIDNLYRQKHTDWNQRKTAKLLDMGLGSVNRALELARAAEMVPEIGNAKTASDAIKMIERLEEQVVVEEMIRSQDTKPLDKGIKAMITQAKQDYSIGDVFASLKKIKDNSKIHIIECDPPYGIDLDTQKRGKENVDSTIKGYNEIERSNYPDFLGRLTKELYRVAAKDSWLVFWFGPTWQREVLDSLRNAGWKVDDIPALWIKPQGQTNSPDRYLGRAYEPFYMCRKGEPYLNKKGRLNTFLYPNDSNKYHPTQRPIALMEDILETLGVDMMTVLVPFLGSGVTLRAAYKQGMKAFGFDSNEQYKGEFLLAVEQDAKELNE